jgi:hypothetical protein
MHFSAFRVIIPVGCWEWGGYNCTDLEHSNILDSVLVLADTPELIILLFSLTTKKAFNQIGLSRFDTERNILNKMTPERTVNTIFEVYLRPR